MSDREFATVIALILYNEHNGWFEDLFPPARAVTPLYQLAQTEFNASGLGTNFSVWPANLRPSVALEILRQQLPLPGPGRAISVPVIVWGSRIDPAAYRSRGELFAAITTEIGNEELAVEYLAANLERGVYRARHEGVPVKWRAMAAWHNQGIVLPEQIARSATALDYLRRGATYRELARRLIDEE
jgi:hypothetical protein